MTNATCEQCRTSEGTAHEFHYGRDTTADDQTIYHASAYPGAPLSPWTDRYQIGGIEAVVLCDGCLRRARSRRAARVLWDWVREPIAMLGYLAWVVALAVWAWQGEWSRFGAGIAVGLGVTFVAFATAYTVLRDEDFAQHLAVDLHQEKLRDEGWDTFWTSSEFLHLAPH